MINILIADDSETETMLLRHIFKNVADFCVIGCAKNGKEAVELASKLKPDIITMDINMPLLDGFEATRQIMATDPIPIVVITSTVYDASLNTAFLALESGALSVLDKPVNVADPSFETICKRIITLIRTMAEIKVIKRRFVVDSQKQQTIKLPQLQSKIKNYEIVAIGSSVGGPQALKNILSQLPADFPISIVITQHMTIGFIDGLSQWLDAHCALRVKCAEDQEILEAGTVYFAPDKSHLKIIRVGTKLMAHLFQAEPVSGFFPSITVLLNSVARSCGERAIAILLTGMGSDGAQGLLDVKSSTGHTLIQDQDSCVVFGMAGVAQSLGAVDRVLKLDEIAQYLLKLC